MNKKPHIIVSVISDLVTDQRVHKVCNSLSLAGYQVSLIGAKRKHSLALTQRVYKAMRIHMLFQKKVFFYAEINTRLFLKLLFTRGDIFLGNDLDVMPAVFLAARLKGKPVVYDTHEYYLGMPELEGKPTIKKIWAFIEHLIFPRLKYIYTICQSFCDLYNKDYGKKLWFIRNVPYLHVEDSGKFEELKQNIDLRIPRGKFLLLFQGAGINPERGVEELVLSMQYLDPTLFHLLIVGGGDIFEKIIHITNEKGLKDRITIIPKVPFEVLRHITRQADLGLTLDKPTNINHIYGLPNKIFDYLHSGIPVLSSRLVEMEHIIQNYEVGSFIENHEPVHIAERIRFVYDHPDLVKIWRSNTIKVKNDYNWENEEKVLFSIYEKVSREAGLDA